MTRGWELFDAVDVPIIVIGADGSMRSNAAALATFGEAPPGRVEDKIRHVCDAAELDFMLGLEELRKKRDSLPTAVFGHLRGADGAMRFCKMAALRFDQGHTLITIQDADPEASSSRFSRVLTETAGELMRARDEDRIMALVRQALATQGLRTSFFCVDENDLIAPPEGLCAESRASLGGRGLRVPLSSIRGLGEWLPLGDTLFLQQASLELDALTGESRELAEILLRGPHLLAASILTGDLPWAVLLVEGETLSPAKAATLGLFSRQIGAAVENARHHLHAAKRVRELSELQAERIARERLTAIGEAAAIVAHEVRNPLGAILNAVALLSKGGERIDSAAMLALITEEAQQIDDLVRDLLDLVRPLEVRQRPAELQPLVHQVIENARALAPKVTFELQSEELPLAEIDPHLMQIAVEHLVRNARQASRAGGRVLLRLQQSGDEVHLRVLDSGPGIAEEDRDRIFDPFFSRKGAGRGLGLAVVRRVAEAHEGAIELLTQVPPGAEFRLRLPIQRRSK